MLDAETMLCSASTIEDIILAWRQYLLKTGAEAEAPKHIPLFT